MSIADIEQVVEHRELYDYVLARLSGVLPWQVTTNPETGQYVTIDGASGFVIPGFGSDTEAEAIEAWRKGNALMLSADWGAMLERLIAAQPTGELPDEDNDVDSDEETQTA